MKFLQSILQMGTSFSRHEGKTIVRLLAFVFIGLLGFSNSALATPIKWTLSNVTFADGGTATGYFIFDTDDVPAYPFSVLSWSISVQGGDTENFPAITYDSSTGSLSSFSADFAFGFRNPAFLNPNLRESDLDLALHASLTDAGGTVPLIAGVCLTSNCIGGTEEREFCDPDCSTSTPRIAVSGVLIGSTVPEPSTFLLLASGLAALVLIRKKALVKLVSVPKLAKSDAGVGCGVEDLRS